MQAQWQSEEDKEGIRWPSVIGEEDPSCLQVSDGSPERRTQTAGLFIIVMLVSCRSRSFGLELEARDNVGSSDESLIVDHITCQLARIVGIESKISKSMVHRKPNQIFELRV
jgi:hypothetical protein